MDTIRDRQTDRRPGKNNRYPNPSGGDIIQTKRPNLRVLSQNDANGIANSEDPDQTAPLEAV